MTDITLPARHAKGFKLRVQMAAYHQTLNVPHP
jgi:hypothetical protein